MDIGKTVGKIPKWLHEYRYPIVIVLAGLIMVGLSSRKSSATAKEPTAAVVEQTEKADLTQQLTKLLTQMDGVGKVQVMLSISVGETTYYYSDEDIVTGEGSSSVRKDTVIITDSARNQTALVTRVVPAQYAGAVVVCQGADRPSVRLAVVEAVSKATGLGADHISVLKMK